jgi:hypothetical protein
MDFGSGTSSHSDIAVDVNLQDVRVGESPSTSLQPETQNFDSIFEYENYRKEIWPFLPDVQNICVILGKQLKVFIKFSEHNSSKSLVSARCIPLRWSLHISV